MGIAEGEREKPLHPLIRDRLYLSQRMGEILADAGRYNSPEFRVCLDEIDLVNRQLHEGNIDLSPLLQPGAFQIDGAHETPLL